MRWWEEHHKEWENRVTIAGKALHRIPQDKLKECLAYRYDEIMDLFRVTEVDHGSAGSKSTSGVPGLFQTTSVVPQKRTRKTYK